MSHDLLLSSGFLAFARHAGFLAAIEQHALPHDAIVGTSSGALVGALWAAGMPARDVLRVLTERRPTAWLRAHPRPWRGLFTLDRFAAGLRPYLPERFEHLPRPLAVGVAADAGTHLLIHEGPLIEAVVASCAVPYLFTPVRVGGRWLRDGAVLDRLGLDAWRAWRPDHPALVHLIDRSHGADRPLDLGALPVVRSPPSGARLWDLGDTDAQFEHSLQHTLAALRPQRPSVRQSCSPTP